jgi:hypothetical protein
MSTPAYRGCGQPKVDNGLFSGLSSWFGVQTPAYAGEGQPIADASGYFGSSTPAYQTEPTRGSSGQAAEITVLIPSDLVTQKP